VHTEYRTLWSAEVVIKGQGCVYCVEGYGFCWGTCHMHSLYQNGKQAGRLLPHNSALRSPPSTVQIRTAHVAVTGYLSSSGSLTTQAFSFPHSIKANTGTGSRIKPRTTSSKYLSWSLLGAFAKFRRKKDY